MEIFIMAAFLCAPPKLRSVHLHETSFFFFQFLPRHLSYNFRWIYPSFKLSNDAQDISSILFQHTERRENRAGKFEDIENIILSLMGHSDACRGNTLTGALLYFLVILRSFERPSETFKKFHRILRIVRKWILSAIKICQLLTVVPNSSTCRSTIRESRFLLLQELRSLKKLKPIPGNWFLLCKNIFTQFFFF